MSERLFVVAAKNKYRFSLKPIRGLTGEINTEDLFDLNRTQLNEMGKYYKTLLGSVEDSWMETPSKEDLVIKNKLEIIKYVFDYKEKAKETAEKAAASREQNQRLLELRKEAELRKFAGMSPEEIDKLIQKEESTVDDLAY